MQILPPRHEGTDTSLFESAFISERKIPGIKILHFFKVYMRTDISINNSFEKKTLFANDCLLASTAENDKSIIS
ncbi:MAG: hypothetical protein A2Y08_03255 [Planctomycetes bacterium GWA2_40_7]|nr:MAG: hypothetical protein A2Y08_03255 [Planctomycetes bacterium GWA2_40_7]